MIFNIHIPHHFTRLGDKGVEYLDLRVAVQGEAGSRRVVHLYVEDPEHRGGTPKLQFAESREEVPEGAVYIDYWEVRFPS